MNPKIVEMLGKAFVAALGAVGAWAAKNGIKNRKKK
jgi:hypothetical protein